MVVRLSELKQFRRKREMVSLFSFRDLDQRVEGEDSEQSDGDAFWARNDRNAMAILPFNYSIENSEHDGNA